MYDKYSDKHFSYPTVITVEKYDSIILALEYREMNKQVHKSKYQTPPKIDELVDGTKQMIADQNPVTHFFLQYLILGMLMSRRYWKQKQVYRHLPKFRNGCYGLNTMRIEVQKVIATLYKKLPQTHAFFDDILKISEGTTNG